MTDRQAREVKLVADALLMALEAMTPDQREAVFDAVAEVYCPRCWWLHTESADTGPCQCGRDE
jgi:hypothetical protein